MQRIYKFIADYHNIPKSNKENYITEDSWYYDQYVLAVADGVGGDRKHGANLAAYANKLTTNIAELIKKTVVFIYNIQKNY